ncbi:hypothetical protein [Ramlibacter sp.]|uniref:hypothetical protein n=1 Tax=Ramlibacter sp. TaxID=1917967 RepID=UPI0018487A56|nr:hypothetical protein [Ramlibacter sp.]MBA2674239.1 hypothetical protein [Ramlibacter sp.]
MHSAPSVTYPVGRCRFAAGLAVGIWLAGALVLAAWLAQTPGPGWRHGIAAAALAFAAVFACAAWLRGARGTLAWDGGQWWWEPARGAAAAPQQAGEIRIRLDLQRWLLLAWQGEPGGPNWLWLERKRAPLHWDALRRAVYSRARTEGPQGRDEQPPAEP